MSLSALCFWPRRTRGRAPSAGRATQHAIPAQKLSKTSLQAICRKEQEICREEQEKSRAQNMEAGETRAKMLALNHRGPLATRGLNGSRARSAPRSRSARHSRRTAEQTQFDPSPSRRRAFGRDAAAIGRKARVGHFSTLSSPEKISKPICRQSAGKNRKSAGKSRKKQEKSRA